ncbi:hypothetical protein ACA910_012669 [Epithemia clementina (nom. ined.)]
MQKPWHYEGFLENETDCRKAESWLHRLQIESPHLVDRQAFLVVLRSLAVSGAGGAHLRAEKLIRTLEQLAADSAEQNHDNPQRTAELQPDSECYQRVIEAWANAEKEDIRVSVVRAEKMLQAPRQPDTLCLNAFLDLCTKGRGLKTGRTKYMVPKNAQKAESILRSMIADRKERGSQSRIAPNLDSFNFVIRGWTRCRQHPRIVEKTAAVLKRLEQYNLDPDVRPNIKSYVMLMDALNAHMKQKLENLSSKTSDNSDCNGMAEMNALELIIKELHQKELEGHTYLAPCTFTYNNLITGWAIMSTKFQKAPFEAEKVVHKMCVLRNAGHDVAAPDAVSYSLVIRAWLNSSHHTRAPRAAWWLSKLWQDYNMTGDDRLLPTTEIYNKVIAAWSLSEQPAMAENCLNELVSHYEKLSIPSLAPNSTTFSTVIRGWTNFAHNKLSKDALLRAVHWLDVLINLEKEEFAGIATPEEVFDVILSATSIIAPTNPDVLDTAVATFEKLQRSNIAPTCRSYSRLLKTGLQALSLPENDRVRDAFVKELIKDCADAGLLGRAVVREIANGDVYESGWTFKESKRLSAELFPEWPLPLSWTRNLYREEMPDKKDIVRGNFANIRPHRHGASGERRNNENE